MDSPLERVGKPPERAYQWVRCRLEGSKVRRLEVLCGFGSCSTESLSQMIAEQITQSNSGIRRRIFSFCVTPSSLIEY